MALQSPKIDWAGIKLPARTFYYNHSEMLKITLDENFIYFLNVCFYFELDDVISLDS